jgi:hypothetical protein
MNLRSPIVRVKMGMLKDKFPNLSYIFGREA